MYTQTDLVSYPAIDKGSVPAAGDIPGIVRHVWCLHRYITSSHRAHCGTAEKITATIQFEIVTRDQSPLPVPNTFSSPPPQCPASLVIAPPKPRSCQHSRTDCTNRIPSQISQSDITREAARSPRHALGVCDFFLLWDRVLSLHRVKVSFGFLMNRCRSPDYR